MARGAVEVVGPEMIILDHARRDEDQEEAENNHDNTKNDPGDAADGRNKYAPEDVKEPPPDVRLHQRRPLDEELHLHDLDDGTKSAGHEEVNAENDALRTARVPDLRAG